MGLKLPRSRKTVEVGRLLNMANTYLAHKDSTPDGREAIASMIEGVLLHTRQYKGFAYLPADEVEGAGSRRRYFVAPSLMEAYEKNEKENNF